MTSAQLNETCTVCHAHVSQRTRQAQPSSTCPHDCGQHDVDVDTEHSRPTTMRGGPASSHSKFLDPRSSRELHMPGSFDQDPVAMQEVRHTASHVSHHSRDGQQRHNTTGRGYVPRRHEDGSTRHSVEDVRHGSASDGPGDVILDRSTNRHGERSEEPRSRSAPHSDTPPSWAEVTRRDIAKVAVDVVKGTAALFDHNKPKRSATDELRRKNQQIKELQEQLEKYKAQEASMEKELGLLAANRDAYKKDLQHISKEFELLRDNHAKLQRNYHKRESEVRDLQVRDYEANRKGSVLLDESAQNSIEEVLVNKVSSWTRGCFRGVSWQAVLEVLSTPVGSDVIYALSPNGFLTSNYGALLKRFGAPTFFQILITNTLVDRLLKRPFRGVAVPGLRQGLDDLCHGASNVDRFAASSWRAETVKMIDLLQAHPEAIPQNGGFGIIDDSALEVLNCELVSALQPFLDLNMKLNNQEKMANIMKLRDIVEELGSITLEWLKHPFVLLVLDNSEFSDDTSLNIERKGHLCTTYKHTVEEDDGTIYRVAAIVIPGFVKFTKADMPGGREKWVVWSKATVGLLSDDELSQEFHPQATHHAKSTALPTERRDFDGDKGHPENLPPTCAETGAQPPHNRENTEQGMEGVDLIDLTEKPSIVRCTEEMDLSRG